MKTPKAEKLPSGKWRCRVVVNGKRESITADTKKEAEQLAAAAKLGYAGKAIKNNITVGEKIDAYIEQKAPVLSPSTLREYKSMRKHAYKSIENKTSDLSDEEIQDWINEKVKEKKSPKGIRNAYGLLSASLERGIKITLPKKVKSDLRLPTEKEIEILSKYFRGKQFELPFLLAAELGLRSSEILGLTWDCVVEDQIHIKQAKVYGENGMILKAPKTYHSDRWLPMTPRIKEILDIMPRNDENIVTYYRTSMLNCLRRGCEACGIKPFRMHDLRHYNVSVMIKLGIPNMYGMERIGHTSDYTYQHVYGYIMDDGRKNAANKIAEHFAKNGHEMDTK